MNLMNSDLNIEKRNKILQRTKSAMRTFIPEWQYDYIKQNHTSIMNFINNNYNKDLYNYKNYNEELVKIYDYFQNDNNLKYLMTRFFNMLNSTYIIDKRKDEIDKVLFSLLEEEKRNVLLEKTYKEDELIISNGPKNKTKMRR